MKRTPVSDLALDVLSVLPQFPDWVPRSTIAGDIAEGKQDPVTLRNIRIAIETELAAIFTIKVSGRERDHQGRRVPPRDRVQYSLPTNEWLTAQEYLKKFWLPKQT